MGLTASLKSFLSNPDRPFGPLDIARPFVRIAKPAPQLPTKPVSKRWGYDRGTPIARHYIDRFMAEHSRDITGHVLEIKDRLYTKRFGHDIAHSDVLDIDASNREATIVADLASADAVPDGTYDCVIVNETLQFVFDVRSAIAHLHRMLKPGGVLLASVPCTAQIDRELPQLDYWRFTDAACRTLIGEVFGPDQVTVKSYGNYATCVAGLSGLAAEEIDEELLHREPDGYAQGVLIHAVK